MRLITLSLAAALLLPACTTDDPGDVAWIQQAIPTTLGRKARGSAEIAALEQVLDDNGGDRTVVLDVLAAQPEYVDYWTLVVADLLEVRRTGNDLPQDPACWAEPLVSDDPVQALALAEHIRGNDADVPFSEPWNMTDAVMAAVVADDLTVAYLAYLPALMGVVEDMGDGNDAAAQFEDVYIGRNPGCLACHSSSYSVVDDHSGWDRHATAPWALDKSVFDGGVLATLMPAFSPMADDYAEGERVYDDHCSTCHDAAAGSRAADTVVDCGDGPMTLDARVPVLTGDDLEGQIRYGSACMTPFDLILSDEEVSDVQVWLRANFGAHGDVAKYFRHTTVDEASGIRPWGIDAACGPYVGSDPLDPDTERLPGFAGDTSSDPTVIDLAFALEFGMGFLDWDLDNQPDVVAADQLPSMNGYSAFAYLVAARAADGLAKHFLGTTMTTDNGFARNSDQEGMRHALVQSMYTWDPDASEFELSLRGAISSLSSSFNAPADSEIDDPWWWPMFLDPWVADDPREPASLLPGANANGPGDLVHRYDPVTALYAVHHSLGWPAPEIFPPDTYPTLALHSTIGAYLSFDAPGFDDWDMQSLLYWETQFGACNSPAGDDWISELILAGIADTDVPGPTVEDAFAAVRDRLLGSPVFATDEQQTIEEILFGVGSPTTLADVPFPQSSPAGQATLDRALRDYCGALLMSPQYLMAGLPLETTLPPAPRLVVCLPDEPACTESELYDAYTAILAAP